MQIKHFMLLLIAGTLLLQCKSKKSIQKQAPQGLQIHMRKSSGMVADGYAIKVHTVDNSIFVSLYTAASYPEKTFITTKAAIDSLYSFIKSKNLEEFTYTVNKKVRDRGGREILMIYPDKKILVSNKGEYFIDETYLKKFREVADYIEAWTNRHTGNFLEQ